MHTDWEQWLTRVGTKREQSRISEEAMNHVSSWSRTHDTGLNPKGGPFPLLLHKLTISSVKKPRCRVAHYPLLAVTYQLNFRDRFKIL